MIPFADSIHPELIERSDFSHVAAYANGLFEWPAAQLARFPAHVEIAVKSGDPGQAQIARVLDVERFDAVPADFPPFAAERIALGHLDPTAYTSIIGDPGFGIGNLLEEIEAAHLVTWRLWVAWYWLRPFAPTATEVLAEIKTLTGITLDPKRLWACQWQAGTTLDRSVLYGRDDFTRTAP